jgi:hypothetical protein
VEGTFFASSDLDHSLLFLNKTQIAFLCYLETVAKARWNVEPLLKEIRHNPMLWLLVLVPVVLIAAKLDPTAHTLLFVLSVLAIVPLAALLSHATESVAEKTGDTVGGLLNATLGNLRN